MERMSLAGRVRQKTGKEAAKQERRLGFIPATVYGHGMKPLSLAVAAKDFKRVIHTKAGENAVINLRVEGVQLAESTCLIKEIQHHPVSDEISHVDFTVISLTEKIQVKVPLIVVHSEEAVGVKEGGILDIIHHEIDVECLPTDIPEKFEVDIKGMKIGDAIAAKDLAIPKKITCRLSPEEVVIALHPPAKEEEKVIEEEAVAEPEVIEKGKKVEAEEGAAPAAKPTGAPVSKPEKPAKTEKSEKTEKPAKKE